MTAQLINAADGFHLWSERYDRTMDDVFEVQDDIARSVVEKLKVKLLRGPESLVKSQENLEAYQWFLRGRHVVVRGTPESYAQAMEYFDNALSEQPDYAEALAGKAWVYEWQSMAGCLAPPAVMMPQAKEAVLQSLQIDDSAAMAHFVRAELALFYDWDWPGAEREYRRATSLNPGLALAHANFSMFLALMGRSEESLASAERAITLDPIGPHAHRHLAMALSSGGRYREAEREAQKVLGLEPGFVPAYWELVIAYAGLGEPDRVLQAAEQGRAYAPNDPMLLSFYGWASGKTGRTQQAEALAAALEQRRREGYFSAALIAGCYTGLGDIDRAVSWMQVACDERDGVGMLFAGRVWYADLCSDARFQALLRKMNFPTPPQPK